MSIKSEAEQDLTLEAQDAEKVVGGLKTSKKKAAHPRTKPVAGAAPKVITVVAATPPVPGPPDPGADNSGPEVDDC